MCSYEGEAALWKAQLLTSEVCEREVSASANTVSVTCSSDVMYGMRGIRYRGIIWLVQDEAWPQLFLYGAVQGRDVQS